MRADEAAEVIGGGAGAAGEDDPCTPVTVRWPGSRRSLEATGELASIHPKYTAGQGSDPVAGYLCPAGRGISEM